MIASSCRVPSRVMAVMARLSDLSGSFSRSFPDSYLTGYPIASMSSYAFARTWLAHEMPRLGSVWTHTLLVQFSDIATSEDLSPLCGLFVRPKADDDARYRDPLFLSPNELSVGPTGCADARAADALRRLYFLASDEPVRVAADAAEPASDERLVLAVWSQQWPSLRRRFRFCTYAPSQRSDEDGPFDLQCGPDSAAQNSMSSTTALEVPVSAAAHDLENPGEFRSFVRTYGVDLDGIRQNFGQLARIFTLLGPGASPADFSSACHLAASGLSPPGKTKTLLQVLADLPARTDALVSVENDVWLLGAIEGGSATAPLISATTFARALDLAAPEMFETILSKIAHAPDARFARMVVRNPPTRLLSSPALAARLLVECRRPGSVGFYRDPHIITSPEFWRVLGPVGLEFLEEAPEHYVDLGELVEPLMEGAPQIVPTLIERSSAFRCAYLAYVRWVPGEGEPEADLALVRSVTFDEVGDGSDLVKTLLDVAGRVAERSGILPGNPERWVDAAADLNAMVFGTLSVEAFAVLFALACDACRTSAAEILVRTFSAVYRHELGDTASSSWKLIEKVCVPDKYVFDWDRRWFIVDRCRRLRRTVASRWLKCKFEPARYLDLTQDPTVFRELCRDTRDMPGGETLLRRAARSEFAQDGGWHAAAYKIIGDEVSTFRLF